MVLGLRAKSRKGPSVHIDYLIHVQEIKPWPPSQSLKSLRSVLLQWENGEKNSGSTSPVVPSLGSGVGDGKIEFGQSFRLPVTLTREFSLKSGDADTFQKNYIEFNLYEPRREMTVKGQHLGTAMIDLAEYGIVREMIIVSAPMNCKRSFRNTPQPLLFVKIQPFDKHSCSSTPKGSLSKESSLNRDGQDSVSALMNGEYAKEAEFASFTDDDTSSHSSLTVTSACEASGDSPTKGKENALEAAKSTTELLNDQPELPSEPEPAELGLNEASERQHLTGSSSGGSSSTNLSSGVESPKNVPESSYDSSQSSLPSMVERAVTNNMQSLPSPIIDEFAEKEVICIKSNSTPELEGLTQQEFSAKLTNGSRLTDENIQESLNRKEIRGNSIEVKVENDIINLNNASCSTKNADHQMEVEDHRKLQGHTSNVIEESGNIDGVHAGLIGEKDGYEQQDDKFEGNNENKNDHSTEFELLNKLSPDAMRKVGAEVGDTALNRSGIWVKSNSLATDRQRHVKSVRSSLDLLKANGSASCNQLIGERKEIDTLESSRSGSRNFTENRRKNMSHSGEARTNSFDGKVQQLEHKVEKLEGELREAAVLELSLYSVVAEHGSSVNKVHAPARRLSRLYLHAWKQWSSARRASAAKSAISGLVLVAKACGNDVPRLSFWLSNSVVLRVIIKSAILDSKPSVFSGLRVESNGSEKKNGKGSLLKWEPSLPSKTEISVGINENNWEDPLTFTTALEKIEAWIFSRIIESVWWQTLTPHMQSASRKVNEQRMRSSLQNSCGKNPILGDQEQANISLELWKIAFKDACERICPVRAAGHECGCLPVLARLVMEQCVSRLDVAMFNAILRESDDEIPTDPVSDPISDLKVLPIPAGRSSFGAGAQLKNAIGNWSRWLSDLFGIDDDECQDENELSDNNRWDSGTSSKSFPLLNALSDLMMLPKDMLLNRSIRKEVCPTIGVPLIKRILGNFVPDEFCPDPIPVKVFEALDAENILEVEEEYISHFPCDAAPVVYLPPSAASLVSIPGEVGNGSPSTISASSLLRKSYTSDDELEELDSPLASIMDNWRIAATPDQKIKRDARRVVRYQLLQEVWRDGD